MTSEHRRAKWPQADKEMEWLQFHEDATILEATGKDGIDQHLQTMTTVIISLAAEWFGVEEKKKANPPIHYNRAERSTNLGLS